VPTPVIADAADSSGQKRQIEANPYPGRTNPVFLQVVLWIVSIAIWWIAVPPTQFYRYLLDYGQSSTATITASHRRSGRKQNYDDVEFLIHWQGKDLPAKYSYAVPPTAPPLGSDVAVRFLPWKPNYNYAMISKNVDGLTFSLWSRIIFFYCVGGIVPVMALYAAVKLIPPVQKEKELLLGGSQACGVIEKILIDGGRKDDKCQVLYRFKIPASRSEAEMQAEPELQPESQSEAEIEGSIMVSRALVASLKDGDAITVFYDPLAPQQNTVAGLGHYKLANLRVS
jgi:hypothetical protein